MANKIKVSAVKMALAPEINRIIASAVPSDNVYVAGGVALNLSPGAILDPRSLGITGPSQVPFATPGIFQESLGGYYAQVVPASGTGSAGLSTFKLQYFQPGGAEIAAGAYPAAILNGQVLLDIVY